MRKIHEFDVAEARRHLRLLDPAATRFIFAAFPDRQDCSVPPLQRACTLDEFARDVPRLQDAGCGIFVTINEMRGNRRGAAHVARVRAVWGDMDGPLIAPWPLAPTFTVKSSAAPQKFHAYLCVSGALSVEAGAAINSSIVARHGADRNARDLARVLRLAGTWHLKDAPHLVRIQDASGMRYPAAELMQAFPPVTPPLKVTSPPIRFDASLQGMKRQALDDLETEVAFLSGLTTGRRSAVFRAGCRLAKYVANGILLETEVLEALVAAYVDCDGPGGSVYAKGAVRRAIEKGRGDRLPPLAKRYRTEARHVA